MKILTIRDYIESLSVLMGDAETFRDDRGVWCFSRDRVLELLNDIAYDVDLNPEEGSQPLGEDSDHGRWSENLQQEHRSGGALEAEVASGVDDGVRRSRTPYSAFGILGPQGGARPQDRATQQLQAAASARQAARAKARAARRQRRFGRKG